MKVYELKIELKNNINKVTVTADNMQDALDKVFYNNLASSKVVRLEIAEKEVQGWAKLSVK